MFNEEERVVYEVRMEAIAEVESKIASGVAEGLEKGRKEGREEGRNEMVVNAHNSGMTSEEIAKMFQMELGEVEEFLGGGGVNAKSKT